MPAPDAPLDAVFLSPHLDDVALSCGGRVYDMVRSGARVLVATVTAGYSARTLSGFAEMQHAQWALANDAVAARRREDEVACRRLGAAWLHWDELDCIYRYDPYTGEAFYQNDDALFGKVASADMGMMARLVDRLAALPPHRLLFAPLGIGNHVDHQLTRAAAEHFCNGTAAPSLLYYEDYPYAQQTDRFGPGTLSRDLLEPHLFPLSAAAISARVAAVGAFTSQLDTLFGSAEAMADQIRTFVAATGGERYWQRRP